MSVVWGLTLLVYGPFCGHEVPTIALLLFIPFIVVDFAFGGGDR